MPIGGAPSGQIAIVFDARDFAKKAKTMGASIKQINAFLEVRTRFLALAAVRKYSEATPKLTGYLAASTKHVREASLRYRIVQTATAGSRARGAGRAKKNYLYGRGLRLGSKSHVIRPRVKKALFWPGIRGGRPVLIVFHPGQAATRYHFDGFKRLQPFIKATGKSMVAEIGKIYIGKK